MARGPNLTPPQIFSGLQVTGVSSMYTHSLQHRFPCSIVIASIQDYQDSDKDFDIRRDLDVRGNYDKKGDFDVRGNSDVMGDSDWDTNVKGVLMAGELWRQPCYKRGL